MSRHLTLADVGEAVPRKQAAQLLGLGEYALYEAIQRDEVPTVPLGRRLRVPKAYIEHALGRCDHKVCIYHVRSTTTKTRHLRAV